MVGSAREKASNPSGWFDPGLLPHMEPLEQRLLLSAVQSDDFHYVTPGNSLWQFIDPRGDSTLTFNGTDAIISVPSTSEHDLWQGDHSAPRLLQQVDNSDFEVEVKFDSKPVGQYAMNGIIVQADANNFIRFEFQSNSATGMRLFTASFANDSPTARVNKTIAGQNSMFMRVKRQGDQWTESYSYDGATWTTAVSFTYALAVTAVGPFAGNAGGSSGQPAYSSSIDYFFNTASPIIPEDGGVQDTTPPAIQNVTTSSGQDFVDISFNTDEAATAAVQYGLTTGYEMGTVSETGGAGKTHVIRLSGLQPSTTYQYRIVATDTSNNVRNSDNLTVATAGPLQLVNTSISSTTARDGAVLTIGYQITASSASLVSLGCTLRGPNGEILQDTANDKPVSLQVGTNWYYRSFLVNMPPGASTGKYDVSWSVGDSAATTAPKKLTINSPVSVYVPILLYHKIDDVAYSNDYTTTANFRAEMQALQAYGYTPILFSDLMSIRAGTEAAPAKPILLTFDDGYEDLLTKAAPILAEFHFVATSFIPTGRVGGTNAWDTGAMNAGEPVINHLTWNEIQTLSAQGFIDFQPHTVTHPDIRTLSDSQLAYELTASKQALESHLPGHTMLTFCYPYGYGTYDSRIQNAIWAAGYLDAVAASGGIESNSSDKWDLRRVYIDSRYTVNYDPANQSLFYMDRLNDPDVRHPDITINSWEYADPVTSLPLSSNELEPGQSVLVRVNAHNAGETAAVTGSLNLDDDANRNNGLAFQSHTSTPSQDVVTTFVVGTNKTFEWTWTVPNGARVGQYQANVAFHDQYYVLGYKDSPWINAFSVKEAQATHAPSGLSASSSSTSQIDLTWTDNASDETGFQIERSLDGSTNWKVVKTINTPDVQAWSDTGLAVGTSYYYRVSALGVNGNSGYSNIANAMTAQIVTIAATAPNASEVGVNGAFTVSRTTTTGSLNVKYTVAGTATNGIDYQTLSGTVTIAAGQLSATIPLVPKSDSLTEGTESVELTLVPATGYELGAAVTAVANIADSIPSSGLLASDEFNGPTLDGRWQYSDPMGNCSLTMTGSALQIGVAGGKEHDLWPTSSLAPRIMQLGDPGDFEAEVKYNSTPSAVYTMQGFVVQGQGQDILRLNVQNSGGSSLQLFASSYVGGVSKVLLSKTVSGSIPYLKLKREGSLWTFSYSSDGLAWTQAAAFTQALQVVGTGLFVGNAEVRGGDAPAFTGSVDYFHVNQVTPPPPPPTNLPVVDEFNGPTLNGIWRFENPLGDATVTMDGTAARISVPGGKEHDTWLNAYDSPRLMQTIGNVNFNVGAHFTSAPSATYQSEGLLVGGQGQDLLRFDVFSVSGQWNIFASSFIGGTATVRIRKPIVAASSVDLAVERSGDLFTLRYSIDGGTTWVVAGSFSQALAVNSVGVFAGNAGTNATNAPAFTAVVDRFYTL